MKLWFGYDLSKSVRWLEAAGIRVRAHVLIIGPLGFVVCWKARKEDPNP